METCPNCDSEVEETDQYCSQCGTELSGGFERRGAYPPESSPMFGGETWTGTGLKQPTGSATDEQSNEDSEHEATQNTYPPEASPMFGGETWDWFGDSSDSETTAQSADGRSAGSSPMVGGGSRDRHATALRNTLIYAIAALAVVLAWHYFL